MQAFSTIQTPQMNSLTGMASKGLGMITIDTLYFIPISFYGFEFSETNRKVYTKHFIVNQF